MEFGLNKQKLAYCIQASPHIACIQRDDLFAAQTNEDDGEGGKDPVENNSPMAPPKCCRQRRCSKSRHSKNEDSATGDNNTPDSAKDNPLQQDLAQEDGDASPHERAADEEVEDDCRCQNRRISGRGSRTVRLGGW